MTCFKKLVTMKKPLILLVVLAPLASMGQKEIKPSIPKTDKALKENKLDEAKAIIDVTTGSQDFMFDKKGQPTKNAAKAWFYKGVVYAALDTSTNDQFKSLEANPFNVAKEAFEKSKELDKGKSQFFIADPMGLPVLNEQVFSYFANSYFNKAVTAYQDEKDYKKSFQMAEQTLYFIPDDTTILLNTGVYFAPAAEADDKALAYMKKYLELGGKSSDPYVMMFSIYRDNKKDMEAALKVAKEAMEKFPTNTEFPKYELDIYIKTNRLPEAKAVMEKQAMENPTDKESRYFLGLISQELNDLVEARKWYEEAVKLDPKYFEPNLAIAEIVYADAKKVKQQMNQLGITKEDQKKRFELDKIYVEKLKVVLPLFETCEKLSPDEAKVLDPLLNIYADLDNQAQLARVEKKMKALGLLD